MSRYCVMRVMSSPVGVSLREKNSICFVVFEGLYSRDIMLVHRGLGSSYSPTILCNDSDIRLLFLRDCWFRGDLSNKLGCW